MQPPSVWQDNSRQWNDVGPPLRPSPEDIACFERLAAESCVAARCEDPRALLLGVTAEIATMKWPPRTRLVAVDSSPAMIENIWPGNPAARATALCADWFEIPVDTSSQDLVVGDGCLSVLGYRSYDRLAREIRRVLDPRGVFIIRVFTRPDATESLDSVFEDLWAARITSFHAFKWRLAMALHGDTSVGVRLADIWNVWHDAIPDPAAIAARLGWNSATVATIDAYRGKEIFYTFPRLQEYQRVLAPHFSEAARLYPQYELGDRCPTLALRPLPLST